MKPTSSKHNSIAVTTYTVADPDYYPHSDVLGVHVTVTFDGQEASDIIWNRDNPGSWPTDEDVELFADCLLNDLQS